MTPARIALAVMAGIGLVAATGGAAKAVPVCPSLTTVAGWADLGGVCQLEDKIFTIYDGNPEDGVLDGIRNMEPDTGIGFSSTPAGDIHSLSVFPVNASGNGELIYQIEVVAGSGKLITRIDLTASLSGVNDPAVVNLSKEIYSAPDEEAFEARLDIDPATADPDSWVDPTGGRTTFWIIDTYRIPTESETGLVSFTNDFHQTPTETPVPATLALLGAGLVGLGMARRRRR